ncbi:MAG: hypothetical protein KZQ99_08655 [Candidatus Thiodiazotropha sp. (ex Dulcina madagascariensis)]|nr:hypothetical protein [Candidatus Thiodiazotropha sp. (ex Epidulcina cf. delphinae)]MCU7924155.1 hypothetical protein [Candidatus Thiodiazotropha sp. (ex Dulcina madagascariensis)]MCU7925055.1 hypothetical protein [Candidatus Thiodiazotropha sp. (ex Dulcina madagascariensis)]MCU7934935.1 hypothetical protein [Candidatus Thiodiazotropha sp. (ex Dulcina madagascariensis)]
MKEFVTGIDQKDHGVDVHLEGEPIKKEKLDKLSELCHPDGPGCDSDCCTPEFRAQVEGIDVEGMDGNVTMHVRGAVTASEIASNMSKCDCMDKL